MFFKDELNKVLFNSLVCFDTYTIGNPAHINLKVNFSPGALEDIGRDRRNSSSTSLC